MAHVSRRGKRRQARKERRSEKDLSKRLITILDPNSAASEAYWTLGTSLLYAFANSPPQVIVLTSPGPREGKSTTCANLGVVLARAGKSILILDCDLRKPAIHKFFGLRNIAGVTDVLLGKHSLQEVWEEPIEGLKVIPVGPTPRSPSEIPGPQRLSELLASVRNEFDYVLVGAPPVGAPVRLLSELVVLATQGDGVLLVLDAQRIRKRYVRQVISRMEAVGANVLGTVLNNVKAS